jgi:heme/copper-type cytochrome/quinol oxidase subunit 4
MRIFKEEQRFNQTWIIVLMVISTIMPLAILLHTHINNPESFSVLEFVIAILIIILASSMIFFLKMNTRIDDKGIHYKFFPFHLKYKLIKWEEISEAYVRQYDAITEYGGWGLKGGALWKKSNGKAINVSGDIGIQLTLKNGKKLLLGTQKSEDAKRILDTYKSKINTNV